MIILGLSVASARNCTGNGATLRRRVADELNHLTTAAMCSLVKKLTTRPTWR